VPGNSLKGRFEPFEQLHDGAIQLGEREEGTMAKTGQDPAFDQQNTLLDLRFITGPTHTSRDDRDTVVACQFLVGRIQVGLAAMRLIDTTAKVIRVMCPPPLCAGGARSQASSRRRSGTG
jgi:hypothetical protein